jgi:hypothetical protein
METPMGDTAVVSIKQETQEGQPNVYIHLYAQWKGPHVAIDLREGLNRGRWDQPHFLGKNILCEMVRGKEDDDCYYGLSASIVGGSEEPNDAVADRPLITVEPSAQTVTIQGQPPIPFKEYIDLSDVDLLARMGGCSGGSDCPVCERRRAFYEEYRFKEEVGIFHKPPFEKLVNPARRVRVKPS